MQQYGFILAGTGSGCGKTTISLGLMALLKDQGMTVAPFKTGPDYIDPLFHSHVVGKPSYNLDTFMLPHQTAKHLFYEHSKGADIAVVEGVMGMYDGMGPEARGSTHELSTVLGLPIILVVDCKGLYQSVSAVVKGFMSLMPTANIKGVILNHVYGGGHFEFLDQLVQRDCGVPCVGYLPPDKKIALKSRHLGLVQAEEVKDLDARISTLVATFKDSINLKKLLKLCSYENRPVSLPDMPLNAQGIKLGVASDKAFRFYYHDNLELLEAAGAELYYFSPVADEQIPPQVNALYFGGGYPEVFAGQLSANRLLRQQIKQLAEHGMPIYAECGGLMYLADAIINTKGKQDAMCGVFNCNVQMTPRIQRFGYAELNFDGASIRCHEFHRSEVVAPKQANYSFKYQLHKPERPVQWHCGLYRHNVLAGYAHVHFYADFAFTQRIFDLWKGAVQ